MPLARRHIFVSGDLIRADEIVDEWSQLIEVLTGIQSGQIIFNQGFSQPALLVKNQLAGKDVIDFRHNNISLFKIDEDLRLISGVVDVPPFDVVSTTMVAGLNAQFLDGLPLSAFLTSGKKVEWYIPFYFDGIPVAGQKIFSWIAPAGTNMQITEFIASSGIRGGVYPGVSDVADCSVSLKKNGVNISTVVLSNPTFSATFTGTTNLVENDVITATIDSIIGTEPCRNIMVRAKFKQDLVA